MQKTNLLQAKNYQLIMQQAIKKIQHESESKKRRKIIAGRLRFFLWKTTVKEEDDL